MWYTEMYYESIKISKRTFVKKFVKIKKIIKMNMKKKNI